jgi:hypothetical protein
VKREEKREVKRRAGKKGDEERRDWKTNEQKEEKRNVDMIQYTTLLITPYLFTRMHPQHWCHANSGRSYVHRIPFFLRDPRPIDS